VRPAQGNPNLDHPIWPELSWPDGRNLSGVTIRADLCAQSQLSVRPQAVGIPVSAYALPVFFVLSVTGLFTALLWYLAEQKGTH
jgi:hypothetical protein